MSVSRKYKRNRNYRKKRNSRKLKRAGGGIIDTGGLFNHEKNYKITKDKVIKLIGDGNIYIWEEEINSRQEEEINSRQEDQSITPNLIKQNTNPNEIPKENPKDMFIYFPNALMRYVPDVVSNVLRQSNIPTRNHPVETRNLSNAIILNEGLEEIYTNIVDENKFGNFYTTVVDKFQPEIYYVMKNEDKEINYNDIVENGEFKPDISGTLITNFRNKFGIMVGNDTEAEEDRKLYVKSLAWAHNFKFIVENYLPTFFDRDTNFFNIRNDRYKIQSQYDEDKRKYQNFLSMQLNARQMARDRYNELMNKWRKENKGTYWDSKYNPLNIPFKKSETGGRKTRKRRKSKKSKHSKKSRRSRRRH